MYELYIAGISITVFSLLFILKREKKNLALYFACLILAVWGCRFLLYFIKGQIDLINAPLLIVLDQNLFFLDGPLLYFLTRSINQEKFIWRKDVFHFFPFLLALGHAISTYYAIPAEELIRHYQEIAREQAENSFSPHWKEIVFISAILVHNLIYVILSFKKTDSYKKGIRSLYSTLDNIELDWLDLILKIWLGLMFFPLFIFFLNYTMGFIRAGITEMIFTASLLACIVLYCYNLLSHNFADVPGLGAAKEKKPKHSPEEEKQFEGLLAYMEHEQPFLEVDLSLALLANQVDMHPNTLSHLINTYSGGNFFEFVNTYRVEEVKKELEASHEHIMIIAYNNGFKSKSSFNDVFKRKTGLTPSQYRKKMRH
ncbi:MAG: AraC family transcriptional regulator [Bacteroidia bacterium]|nr:AraC family transcriptional regulator [Bacteroidia bacterium]